MKVRVALTAVLLIGLLASTATAANTVSFGPTSPSTVAGQIRAEGTWNADPNWAPITVTLEATSVPGGAYRSKVGTIYYTNKTWANNQGGPVVIDNLPAGMYDVNVKMLFTAGGMNFQTVVSPTIRVTVP
jgi:hypothetical protein